RILAEIAEWNSSQHSLALSGLNDSDPLVQRCAADALARHPDAKNLAPLLVLRHNVNPHDTHLLYVVRMSLRDHLTKDEVFAKLPDQLSSQDVLAIADASQAVP